MINKNYFVKLFIYHFEDCKMLQRKTPKIGYESSKWRNAKSGSLFGELITSIWILSILKNEFIFQFSKECLANITMGHHKWVSNGFLLLRNKVWIWI